MQIVHVVRQFYPAVGGLETAVLNLAQQQVSLGNTVRVVTLNTVFGSKKRLPKVEHLDSIEIRRIGYIGSNRYPIALAILQHVKDADIVHVHAIDFFCDFLALTRPIHRRQMVISTHGGFFHTRFAHRLKLLWLNSISRYTLSCYAFIAATSRSDLAIFQNVRRTGIGVISNGVAIDKRPQLPHSTRPKRIIYFGRIVEHKGIDKLLITFAQLKTMDAGWSLLIAGRPMDDGTLIKLNAKIEELSLFEHIKLILSPDNKQLKELIEQSSLFCSASSYEGFGIAVVEACAASLFPIVSDIPAHRETIVGLGSGALVNYDNPADCAEIILESYRTAAWNSISASKVYSSFSWAEKAARFQEVYDQAKGLSARLIASTSVTVCTREQAVGFIQKAIDVRHTLRVAFLNANLSVIANRNSLVSAALRGFLVLNDGFGVDLASLVLFRKAFPANLNGTDFVPFLLTQLRAGLRIYLLGGSPQTNERVVEVFSNRWPQHKIVGHHHGFDHNYLASAIVTEMTELKPDLTLVAMGCPKQELWLHENLEKVGGVGIAVGALFDFEAGIVPRAPIRLRKIRCEWIFRLYLEPERMWKRYFFGNIAFIIQIGVQLIAGSRV